MILLYLCQITIAFPDDGAWKRFYKQLQHFPMVNIFVEYFKVPIYKKKPFSLNKLFSSISFL